MRYLFSFLFCCLSGFIFSQQSPTTKQSMSETNNNVSFISNFSRETATKDGYYIGGFIIELNSELAAKLDGKKIRISGKYYIEKGIEDNPVQYDKDGKIIYEQGRSIDTKRIPSPTIDIIEE